MIEQTEKEPITARRVKTAEAAAIAPLFNRYRMFYGQAHDLEGAMQFLRERLELEESVVLAASCHGVEIGFAQLYPSFSSVSMKSLWILNDLYVEESWRGRGAARLLLEKARELAAATGAKGIQLSTATGNHAARSLYEQAGYVLDTEFLTYELLRP